MLRKLSLIFTLLVVATAIPLFADSTYNSLASFQASSGALVTQNFAGIAPSNLFNYYGNGGSVTLGAVTYSANPGSDLFIVDAGYYPPFYGFMGSVASLSVQQGAINIASGGIGGGAYAVGFAYNTFGSSGAPLILTLSNGDIFSLNNPDVSGAFFGVVSSTPFTSISLSESGGGVDFGSFDYSTSSTGSPVPEPASIMLLGSGLLGLGGAVRRRFVK